jgi:hypothetical protein
MYAKGSVAQRNLIAGKPTGAENRLLARCHSKLLHSLLPVSNKQASVREWRCTWSELFAFFTK